MSATHCPRCGLTLTDEQAHPGSCPMCGRGASDGLPSTSEAVASAGLSTWKRLVAGFLVVVVLGGVVTVLVGLKGTENRFRLKPKPFVEEIPRPPRVEEPAPGRGGRRDELLPAPGVDEPG